MKATITRLDGIKVEFEGLTDDVVKAVQAYVGEIQPPITVPAIQTWPTLGQPTITWFPSSAAPGSGLK